MYHHFADFYLNCRKEPVTRTLTSFIKKYEVKSISISRFARDSALFLFRPKS